MTSEVVTSSVDDAGIAELILDRVDARNALSARLAAGIAAAATRLDRDPAVRVVVVRSASAAFFSVGADLKERSRLDDVELMAAREHSTAATRALLDIRVPTIAAIRGLALGGGLEVALTCDIIVADDSAVVGMPETGVGIIPGGGGTHLLPRRVGTGRAAELIFTGRRLDATQAHDYGIVDLVTEDALSGAGDLAAAIASKSPTAQRHAKAALRNGAGLSLTHGLAVEDDHWRHAATSADYREGLAAFGAKRPPLWPAISASTPTHSSTPVTTGAHL